MSSVKHSTARMAICLMLFAAPAFGMVSGCANSELARFAPPGIIKYEDLAGDKPMNPTVAARVEERKAEPDAGDFPILSETPGADQRPVKRTSADIDGEKAGLTAARDELSDEISDDRLAASDDVPADLALERDKLKEQVDADNAAAARERREKLKAPPPPEQQ